MDIDQVEQDPTASGIYEIPEGYNPENWLTPEIGDDAATQDATAQSFQQEEQDPNLQDFQ
jgi:hypothetical protein